MCVVWSLSKFKVAGEVGMEEVAIPIFKISTIRESSKYALRQKRRGALRTGRPPIRRGVISTNANIFERRTELLMSRKGFLLEKKPLEKWFPRFSHQGTEKPGDPWRRGQTVSSAGPFKSSFRTWLYCPCSFQT